jgi:delta24-sterol reductase
VITLLEVQLIEAHSYVELTYHKLASMPQAIKKLEEVTRQELNDYLDGIVYAKDWIVVCSVRFVSSLDQAQEIPIQHFTSPKDP